jgi:outer membrane protein OmpA-like peptidoglycan-associated protein
MKARSYLFAILFAFAPCQAQQAAPSGDAPGAKDFEGMPRYEGSSILLQSRQEFGELGLQIGGLSTPDSTDPKEVRKVEGRVHRSTYLLPNTGAGKRSTLEIARNYEESFKQAGFTPVWSGGDAEIRNGPPRKSYGIPALDHQLLTTGVKERRYFCLEKPGLIAAVFVAARSWDHPLRAASEANPWRKDLTIPTDAVLIQVDFVDTRPMEEKMVRLSAAEMKTSLGASGKVAIYGIVFDFNKAEIKPESRPTLEEMAALLKAEPDLKVLVVGHTDNVGTFEFNEDLSKRRARAVVAELHGSHGIATDRMTPLGASFMSPVTTNSTDEGRAKNRRVELVAR